MKRTAIVTGVNKKGIGRGITEVLAQKGMKVLMVSRNEERLKEVEKELKSSGLDIEAWKLDLTDRKELKKTIADIIKKYEKVDILVNNAGLMPLPFSLAETDDGLWDDLIAVNLTATFNMTKALIPHMTERKYGRIINISSVSARKTVAFFVAYAAAKGALHAFTTALANELTSNGITVNCVLPGFTETDEMHRIWGSVAEKSGVTEEELLKPFWEQIPIGRWIQPYEIGHMVSFLASEEAGVVTGQLIKVDGGYDNHD